MELLEGHTLRQRLSADVPLTTGEVLHVLRGICPAVTEAHRQGLVHRDLKPENIFLEQHAGAIVPKVLDFGLAKSLHGDDGAAGTALTDVGVLVGTLEYMSPEQAAGDTASPAWDTWALCIMAHEMLAGRHPFRRDVGAMVPPAADPPAGSLPETAAAFFRTALSTDRSTRPTDPMAFLDACERAFR
jgi:serine/threonine-protein kinase